MKKEDVIFLNQLYKSIGEVSEKIYIAYSQNDADKLELAKKVAFDLRLKIKKVIENGKGKY